jgi:DNA-binding winged helix-turn-helix (wHTH) protein
MRWKVGNFEFNSLTRRLRQTDEIQLERNDARVLVFLIENFDEEYKNDDIVAKVWKEEVKDDSLYKSIQNLRRAFGGKRDSYIVSRPYQLVVTPELISDGEAATAESVVPNVPAVSDSGQPSESSSGPTRDFTLIVDGMIINSVAELLVEDPETDGIRTTCCASYERSLEDLAFASVYASRLVTTKDFRPSLTTPDQPGQEVTARLGEICDQRAYPSDIAGGRLLHVGKIRDGIRADIQGLARCVVDRHSVHFFRDYMVREAAKHLGTHDSLFQEDVDSDKYKFDVTRPYYTNRELQDALGKATDILVSFLPRTPQNSKDRYAKNALREFATQNVLSLITLMWEGEEFAKRTGAWRMPHVLRALVMRKRSPDRAGTQQQQLVRDLVVEHALTTALGHRRKKNRNNIMAALLNLRDDYPFKQIRELLNREHMIFVEPGPQREEKARRVLRQLKTLTASTLVQPDKIQLAHSSALRALDRTKAADYEYELYRVFPELRPNSD